MTRTPSTHNCFMISKIHCRHMSSTKKPILDNTFCTLLKKAYPHNDSEYKVKRLPLEFTSTPEILMNPPPSY